MSKIIGILVLLLAIALPTSAQIYPEETWGDCIGGDGVVEVFMFQTIIDGPISVPVDGDLGYNGSIIIDGNVINVMLGPLSNWNGFPVGPPLVWYSGGRIFYLDYNNCHYRIEWIEDGTLMYEIWKFDESGIEWHSGDGVPYNAGHDVEFGTWHTVYSSRDVAKQFQMESEHSVD